MKRAVLIFLVIVLMTSLVTSDACAGAQVYLTVTVGGGVVIGVVGVFIHLVFVQRIAEQQKQKEQQMIGGLADHAGPPLMNKNLNLGRSNQLNISEREAHPGLEVNFLTLRW